MEEKLTVKQVLDMTVKMLNEIEIPVAMAEKVGKPILAAVNNLWQCIAAIDAQEQKMADNTEPEAVEEQVFGGKA